MVNAFSITNSSIFIASLSRVGIISILKHGALQIEHCKYMIEHSLQHNSTASFENLKIFL